MIRRTIAKAFGRSIERTGEATFASRTLNDPVSLAQGMHKVFRELHAAFLRAAEIVPVRVPRRDEGTEPPRSESPESPESGEALTLTMAVAKMDAESGRSGAAPATLPAPAVPPVTVSEIRPELEGEEFLVDLGAARAEGEHPERRLRFRNTMNGIIWLRAESEHAPPEVRLLSLHPDDAGVPRLIEKPFTRARSSFRFTSARRLVSELLELGSEFATSSSAESGG